MKVTFRNPDGEVFIAEAPSFVLASNLILVARGVLLVKDVSPSERVLTVEELEVACFIEGRWRVDKFWNLPGDTSALKWFQIVSFEG